MVQPKIGTQYDTPSTKKPLFVISVKLGPEKGKFKVPIYDKDKPEVVALQFAEEHGLGEKKRLALEKLFREKISAHIFKMFQR